MASLATVGFNKPIALCLLLGVLALVAGTTSRFYKHKDDQRGRSGNPFNEPARSSLTLDPQAEYQIVSVSANKCVQLVGDPIPEGTEAQIWECGRTKAQRFRFEPVPGGYYKLRVAGTDRCLDVEGNGMGDGAAVKGFACHGGENQQWIVSDADAGTVRLTARHSGRVLDVWFERTDNGALLKQQGWKSSRNQQFRVTVAGQSTAGQDLYRQRGRSRQRHSVEH